MTQPQPDMHQALNNIAWRQCLRYITSDPDRYDAAMQYMARQALVLENALIAIGEAGHD